MSKEKFLQISVRENSLQNEMKTLILETLISNGNQIQFTPKFTNDESVDYFEDYPIVTTLHGRKHKHNIAITRVHAVGDTIFVDGIDVDSDNLHKEFGIEESHYSDILWFIASILGWTDNYMHECFNHVGMIQSDILYISSEMAEKEMQDNHRLLNHELFGEENILEEYQDEYLERQVGNQEKLIELSGFDYDFLMNFYSPNQN